MFAEAMLPTQKLWSLEANAEKARSSQSRYAKNDRIEIIHARLLGDYSVDRTIFKNFVEQWRHVDDANLQTAPVFWGSVSAPKSFDVVLLDGGEYTTYPEWRALRTRTRWLLLDDTNADKCRQVLADVRRDPTWEVVEAFDERNGCALCRRTAPVHTRRIVDCFPFFNELQILELRLSELEGVVDGVVLCESPRTHQGTEKPLYFAENAARYARWGISPVTAREAPAGFRSASPQKHKDRPVTRAWERERFQRQELMRGLEKLDLSPEDLVIVSDVDEIPDRAAVGKLAADGIDSIAALEQDLYHYDLRCIQEGQPKWTRAVVMTWAHLTGARQRCLNTREEPEITPLVASGGWHLSSFGGAEAVREKISACCHGEEDLGPQEQTRDVGEVGERIQRGEDLYRRGFVTLKRIPSVRSYLPRGWLNQSDFLLGGERGAPTRGLLERMVFMTLINTHPESSGAVVEVGAETGDPGGSNSLFFEEILGFRAILIEPNPGSFAKLQANRPKADRHLVAISSEERRLASDGPTSQLVEPGHDGVEVQCVTLSDVLAGVSSPIDLMIVDTEGSELEVLSTFPWDRLDLTVVVVECLSAHSLSKNTPARRLHSAKDSAVRRLLGEKGFVYLFSDKELTNEFWVRPNSPRPECAVQGTPGPR